MSERPQPTPEGFVLTEDEKLWDRISDKRFQELVFDEKTTIHEVKLSSNNYGEFLFVTVSRKTTKGTDRLCLWGLGLHDYRDRWIETEWFYYKPYPNKTTLQQTISPDDARQQIQERRNEIERDSDGSTQSAMGVLFDMLADLSDDDGALSEMEDLGWTLFDHLDDEK